MSLAYAETKDIRRRIQERPLHTWSIMTATSPISTNDEVAVRAVLDAVYTAWADNDADAFVAPYMPGATAVHSGTVMEDRDAIRVTMATVFGGPLKGSEGTHDVQKIRFVGADTAVVLSKGAIRFAGQAEPAPESRTLDGWVLCKHDGDWRVEAFHNCPEIAA
jgi:uncharacterized protein (TIGR02246 family)